MAFLSWERLSHLIYEGVPFNQPLGGKRSVQLVWHGMAGELSLQLPCHSEEPPPKVALANLSITKLVRDGQHWLAVTGKNLSDLQPFHQLAVLCAAIYETPGTTAASALVRGLEGWGELLKKRPLLSEDSQIGLRGELALLHALVDSFGPTAIRSWTAYNTLMPGRHDFRTAHSEIEVKSTRKRARHHWIHGLSQLRPSPGMDLHLLSLQFEQAGAGGGRSLPDCVKQIRIAASAAPVELSHFDNYLATALYRDCDEDFYETKWMLASEPRLIAVNEQVPRLTKELLQPVIDTTAFPRLLEVSYEISCEGLGLPAIHPDFQALLGNAPIE